MGGKLQENTSASYPVTTSLCNVTCLIDTPAGIWMNEIRIHGLLGSPLLQNLGKEVPIRQCTINC